MFRVEEEEEEERKSSVGIIYGAASEGVRSIDLIFELVFIIHFARSFSVATALLDIFLQRH